MVASAQQLREAAAAQGDVQPGVVHARRQRANQIQALRSESAVVTDLRVRLHRLSQGGDPGRDIREPPFGPCYVIDRQGRYRHVGLQEAGYHIPLDLVTVEVRLLGCVTLARPRLIERSHLGAARRAPPLARRPARAGAWIIGVCRAPQWCRRGQAARDKQIAPGDGRPLSHPVLPCCSRRGHLLGPLSPFMGTTAANPGHATTGGSYPRTIRVSSCAQIAIPERR